MKNRVGRKRISTAKRQPNGRVNPEPSGYSPTLVKRMADLAARKMADAFYGTGLGIAFLSGVITRDQCAAGLKWAEARRKWLHAIDASRLDTIAMSVGESRRREGPDPDSFEGYMLTKRDLAACGHYHRLEAVLDGYGARVMRCTRMLAEAPSIISMNHSELDAARKGLEALHLYLLAGRSDRAA